MILTSGVSGLDNCVWEDRFRDTRDCLTFFGPTHSGSEVT